jgi:hypothetical protein
MVSLIAQYFLNHRLNLDEIRWQMQALAGAGYEGVYPHARQGLLTPYFSEDWWQALDAIMAACRASGIQFWIWDEDYFPSGLAGGRVVWEDPGFVARGLEFSLEEREGAGPFEVDFGPGQLLRAFAIRREGETLGELLDVTAHCGTRRQRWTPRRLRHGAYSPLIDSVGHPHWRTSMVDNQFALAWTPPEPGDYLIVAARVVAHSGLHPDILRPETVRRFLELSHERYWERYRDDFGSTIRGAFTDEPSPGGFLYPWTPGFPRAFRDDHGYDLEPYLAHLAVDIDERSATIRHHYRQTQQRLQTTSYVAQIADWCQAHGIQAAGHLTRTEWLSLVAAWWPNQLRSYRPMHIPCADPLGATQGWACAAPYHTGLKVASSAAHLFGREQAGSDVLAVVGDEARLRDLKYLLDYQMALGINHFAVHGLSYSMDGPRKDEVPPSLFYQHTEWKHMPLLLEHVRRTCEALTGGEHICQIAVLYPSTSLACQLLPSTDAAPSPTHPGRVLEDEKRLHELVELLLSHQRDFDFIDEVTLQENVSASGKLSTPEPYSVIILPYLRYVEAATAEALERFLGAGGRVIAVGDLPRALGRTPEEPQWAWEPEGITVVPTMGPAQVADLPGTDVWGQGARDLFVLRRRKQAREYTFVFNRRDAEFTGRVNGAAITIPGRGSVLVDDSTPARRPSPLRLAPQVLEQWCDDWTVEFEPNHVPLAYWHVSPAGESASLDVTGPGFNLLNREPDPAPEGDGPVRYSCRFLLSGELQDAWLILEESSLTGQWRVSVNGHPVETWRRAVVFDCRNIQASIGPALRGGSTPTLNVVTIETQGPGRGLREVPYLYGHFTCEYRYGHLSLPFIRTSVGSSPLVHLQPWNVMGYPTFSGSAVYRRLVRVPAEPDLTLDLGRVEDVAVVRVDGRRLASLAWPPYTCSLADVAPGEHELSIEVTNGPANRNRAAGLPAGLLGPVRLLRGG